MLFLFKIQLWGYKSYGSFSGKQLAVSQIQNIQLNNIYICFMIIRNALYFGICIYCCRLFFWLLKICGTKSFNTKVSLREYKSRLQTKTAGRTDTPKSKQTPMHIYRNKLFDNNWHISDLLQNFLRKCIGQNLVLWLSKPPACMAMF